MRVSTIEYSANQPTLQQIIVPTDSKYAVGVKVTKDGEIISGDLSVGGIAATDNKGGFNIVELSSDGAETLKRFDVAFVNDGAKYDFALQVMQQDLGYIEI